MKQTKEVQEVEEEKVDDLGEVLEKQFEFIPTGSCQFKQRGPYLVCTSCELQHALYIGMDKIMTGIDENGKPILRPRSTL